MGHNELSDLHTEIPHLISITNTSLAEMRQEQLVEGVFNAFGIVNQVFVDGLLFILFSIKDLRQLMTRLVL